MDKLLYDYDLDLTTWVYLSSLLIITVYFKFRPLFRVRNLDLLLIVSIAPAFILISKPGASEAGLIWIFCWGALLLFRMLLDPWLIRRPQLEPNLNTEGLAFLSIAIVVFLVGHVTTQDHSSPEHQLVNSAIQFQPPNPTSQFLVASATTPKTTDGNAIEAVNEDSTATTSRKDFPLFQLMQSGPTCAAFPLDAPDVTSSSTNNWKPKTSDLVIAIISQAMILIGIILIGYRHFGNATTGISVVGLYLLLPSTAMTFDRVDVALPAALILWSLVAYRWPLVSGIFLGLSITAVYYPVFLLPLFIGFYMQRGLIRFSLGALGTVVAILIPVGLLHGLMPTWEHFQYVMCWKTYDQLSPGIWGTVFNPVFRLPIVVTFAVMAASFSVSPIRKNFGTLLSCATAVILGTQFWQPFGSDLNVGWYLPIVLLTVFRPNLDNQVALFVHGEGWRLRPRQADGDLRAA